MGVLAFYVRASINKGVKLVNIRFDSLIWLKLDRNYFCTENNVYVCWVYALPDESPASKYYNGDIFSILQEDIFDYEQIGRVILAENLTLG